MKQTKALTYCTGKIYNSANVSDVRHISIDVQYMKIITPAQDLLSSTGYKDNSLKHAEERVLRARELGIKQWYDRYCFGYETLHFQFQGSIERSDWYACNIDNFKPCEESIQLITKILNAARKTTNDVGLRIITTPDLLIQALKLMKAKEVIYDPDYDRTGRVAMRLGAYYEPLLRSSEQADRMPWERSEFSQ